MTKSLSQLEIFKSIFSRYFNLSTSITGIESFPQPIHPFCCCSLAPRPVVHTIRIFSQIIYTDMYFYSGFSGINRIYTTSFCIFQLYKFILCWFVHYVKSIKSQGPLWNFLGMIHLDAFSTQSEPGSTGTRNLRLVLTIRVKYGVKIDPLNLNYRSISSDYHSSRFKIGDQSS